MYEIGFTGTQRGMTLKQEVLLEDILIQRAPNRVHLGDCKGADAQAHQICQKLEIPTIGHPPLIFIKRAFCVYTEEWPAKEYLARNRDIVHCSSLLIATPKELKEKLRSGTWATIRYARMLKKPHIIIWPDGERYAEG